MSRSIFLGEHQSCSPFNSVQDAPSIKLWGPYFDDFVDISIFMIWGPGGSNLCASRQRALRGYFSPRSPSWKWEVRYFLKFNKNIKFWQLLWTWPFVPDTTSVLGGNVPSGGYFSPKSPFRRWEIVDFLDVYEKRKHFDNSSPNTGPEDWVLRPKY